MRTYVVGRDTSVEVWAGSKASPRWRPIGNVPGFLEVGAMPTDVDTILWQKKRASSGQMNVRWENHYVSLCIKSQLIEFVPGA